MNDYTVDIGGWFSRAWEALKKNWGQLMLFQLVMIAAGFGLVLALIVLFVILALVLGGVMGEMNDIDSIMEDPLVSFLITIPITLLLTPFQAYCIGGLYSGALKSVRGETPSLGEMLTAGKTHFMPLFIYSLIMSAVGIILQGIQVPIKYLPVPLSAILLFAFLGVQFLLAFFVFLPLTYAPFRIIDRGGVLESIRVSFSRFYKHPFMNIIYLIFAVFIAAGVGLSGLAACCIGVIFTLPLLMPIVAPVLFASAYNDIFKEE